MNVTFDLTVEFNKKARAGVYQIYSDRMEGSVKFKSIWGDDPRDTKMITLGHKEFNKWAKHNKKKIYQAWLNGFKMMSF